MVDNGEHFKASDPNRTWTMGNYGTPNTPPESSLAEVSGHSLEDISRGGDMAIRAVTGFGVDPALATAEAMGLTEKQSLPVTELGQPESAADWVARQGRITAADRANRDAAGLPPRPLDLK